MMEHVHIVKKRSVVGVQEVQTFWEDRLPAGSVQTVMDMNRDVNTTADADEESIINKSSQVPCRDMGT